MRRARSSTFLESSCGQWEIYDEVKSSRCRLPWYMQKAGFCIGRITSAHEKMGIVNERVWTRSCLIDTRISRAREIRKSYEVLWSYGGTVRQVWLHSHGG